MKWFKKAYDKIKKPIEWIEIPVKYPINKIKDKIEDMRSEEE